MKHRVPPVHGSLALDRSLDDDAHFTHQPTSSANLPDPQPLCENLTRCILEVLAGVRDLEQLARHVTDSVYDQLHKRVAIAARARQARRAPIVRPSFTIGSITLCEPRDGVVEAVVIVLGRGRARAVALRLEGLDRRWRATALSVL